MRAFLLPALCAALAACAADDPLGEAPLRSDGDVVVGTVVSVDTTPVAYDGNATFVVDADGERVVVSVPARANLCAAEGLGLVFELAAGDRVEVQGEARDGAVVPCESGDHFIRRGR